MTINNRSHTLLYFFPSPFVLASWIVTRKLRSAGFNCGMSSPSMDGSRPLEESRDALEESRDELRESFDNLLSGIARSLDRICGDASLRIDFGEAGTPGVLRTFWGCPPLPGTVVPIEFRSAVTPTISCGLRSISFLFESFEYVLGCDGDLAIRLPKGDEANIFRLPDLSVFGDASS